MNTTKTVLRKIFSPLELFLQMEASSGLILLMVAAIAMIWSNSAWHQSYHDFIHYPISIQVGSLIAMNETLHFWVNDGLMVLFFFVVGLEIKRELLMGELSSRQKAALPFLAALGGMVAPALIYTLFNFDSIGRPGWGVPMATDIAFAVGILALMSKKVPFALRVFLLALAIVDDLGAVLVIAFFYTEQISVQGIQIATIGLVAIWTVKTLGVQRLTVYTLLGAVVWFGVLQSGIHATIAGVILGFMTPPEPRGHSPMDSLIHAFHPWVTYFIMPLFALVNAGVHIENFSVESLFSHPVSLGVMAGLVLGKPIGIVLACWLGVKGKVASLPRDTGWYLITCVGVIGGIGFTMALFVSHLAFGGASPDLENYSKLGILIGSLIAGLAGLLMLALGPNGSDEQLSSKQ